MKIKRWDTTANNGNGGWVEDAPDVYIENIVASNAPSSSNFLRGDGVWAIPGVGSHNLTSHSDVTITTPSTGQVLKYNGSIWVNGTDSSTDSTKLPLTGGTLSGGLTVNANVSANRYYQIANGVPTGNLGSPTVTEMALFDEQFNNKTAFYPINNLKFYTSTNNSTWTEVTNISDANKKAFVGGDSGTSISIPNLTPYYRIEVINNGAYVFLNALYMYVTTSSHSMSIKIKARRRSDLTFVNITNSDATVNLWPGHVYLPFNTIPYLTGGSSSGHYDIVHIDIQPTWAGGTYASANINLHKLQIWGGYPAGKRNVYSTDADRNVSFPAALTGTRLISTIATGTSPLAVTSTTVVTNLNADLLDGVEGTNYFRVDGTYPNADMNTTVEGYWHVQPTAVNLPIPQFGHRWDYDHLNNGQWVAQFYSATSDTDSLWFRQKRNYAAQPWQKLWSSTNHGTGSGLDADLLDGQHASAFALSTHTHDDRYYTETETDTLLNTKLNTSARGAANGVASLDANSKIPVAQLPNSVFDSLYFYGTAGAGTTQLRELGLAAVADANTVGRSALGYYWVATAAATLSGTPGGFGTVTVGGLVAATAGFTPREEGVSGGLGENLETGDWFILTQITGLGTVASPYGFTFATVNNTYELASTTVDGIVRLSNTTTISSATTGSQVITQGVLGGLIGTAANTIAAGNHTHSIANVTGLQTALDAKVAKAGDTMTGVLNFSGAETHIKLQEDHFILRRFNNPEAVVNTSPAYVLLCRNAANNDVNGTITMDRTSGFLHASTVDILVSAGTALAPVGTCRSMSTSGNGQPSYRLVTLTYSGFSYIALKIDNPDTYYDTSGMYFTGRIKTTDITNELRVVAPASVSAVSNFGTHESHEINGNKVFHDGYHPNADTLTTSRTLTIGSTGKTFNGSADVSWTLAEIGAAASSATVNLTGAQTITGEKTFSVMQIFSSPVTTTQDDWQNSPISIRERGLAGAGTGADNQSPNLNFHWASRQSFSLWMGSNGWLNYGDYSTTGVPGAAGTIRAGTFSGALSGNATTATTLQNARTLTIGSTGKTFNGSADVSWSLTDIGLGNVTNESKATMFTSPTLTGTPTAPTAAAGTNTTQLATTAFVQTAVSGLVDSAPGTLDTLNELAAALGDDPNFATTVSNSIGTKVTANTAITAGTATKITYDTKGLVTSGTTLAAGDLPTHTHTWGNISGGSVNDWGGLRHSTASGYIDFGPANTSHAHIYTDRPNFYFNKNLLVNGVTLTGNTGTVTSVVTGSGLTGGTITTSGTLSVDSTVIRTTGNQTIAATAIGPILTVSKTGSAPGNGTAMLVYNQFGNHSWGIAGEFRNGSASGTDRPSILFSTEHNTNTWSVGYGFTDDNFRIKQDHGHRNQAWGTTRFSLNRSGAGYLGELTNRIFADDYHPNADTLTTARTINGVSFNGSADITITAAPTAHTHAIADVTGLQTALDGKLGTGAKAADADLLDGFNSSVASTANTVVVRDANAYIYASFFNSSRADQTTAAASYIYDTGDGWMRKKTLANAQTEIVSSAAVTAHAPSKTGTGASGTWSISVTGSSGSTTGNAATATTLATGRTLTIGNTGKSFNGSAAVSWTLAEIGAQAAGSYAAASHNHDASHITTGTIDVARLPAIAITDTFTGTTLANFVSTVYSIAPTSVQKGDILILTTDNQTYVHNGGTAGTAADFTLLRTPTDLVTSVASKTGAVTLVKGDVGLGNVDNTADSSKTVANANRWTSDRTITIGNTGKTVNGTGNVSWTLAEIGATNNTGTVTSVGLSLPTSVFTGTGSVTTSGTLTRTFANQNANTVFAGPTTGLPDVPAFRTLVADDLPAHTHAGTDITSGTINIARMPLTLMAGNTSSTFWNPQNNSIPMYSNAVGWYTTNVLSGITFTQRLASNVSTAVNTTAVQVFSFDNLAAGTYQFFTTGRIDKVGSTSSRRYEVYFTCDNTANYSNILAFVSFSPTTTDNNPIGITAVNHTTFSTATSSITSLIGQGFAGTTAATAVSGMMYNANGTFTITGTRNFRMHIRQNAGSSSDIVRVQAGSFMNLYRVS